MAGRPVLVLGATGSFGGALVQELLDRGRPVRALVRDRDRARARFGRDHFLTLQSGDALDPAAVHKAAAGCSVIVHGINYPYDQWTPNMYVATENVIAAAEAEQATIVFPGNVYGLGLQGDRRLDEAAENRPCSAKGVLRAELEAELRRAAGEGPARVLIVRAGDYFGPTARNGMIDPIFGNAARGKAIQAFGRLDIPHQWAYLPDLARLTADLLEAPGRLAAYQVVHFAGHVAERQADFLRLVAREAGHPDLAVRRLPWSLLRVAGLFSGPIHELMEMRYLFDGSVVIEDTRLGKLLPRFRPTPVDEAVRATIESYRA